MFESYNLCVYEYLNLVNIYDICGGLIEQTCQDCFTSFFETEFLRLEDPLAPLKDGFWISPPTKISSKSKTKKINFLECPA